MPGSTIAVPSQLLPAGLRRSAGSHLTLRRYGEHEEDLDVDFAATRPELVSRLIACCARGDDGLAITPAQADELSVGTRIVCLLLLVAMEGRQELDPVLVCPASGCGQGIELPLAIEEILSFAPAEPDIAIEIELEGQRVALRRPTGADQHAWLQYGFVNEEDALLAVVRSLAISGLPDTQPDAWLASLEESLEEHDPLVCFSLDAVCPFCETVSRQEVPLTGLALPVLQAAQDRLGRSVHSLAARDGWSEAEVFAVPAWRRARYLQLIEAGVR